MNAVNIDRNCVTLVVLKCLTFAPSLTLNENEMKNLINTVLTCITIAALLLMSSGKVAAQSVEFGLRYMPTFSNFKVFTPGNGNKLGDYTNGNGFGAILGINFTDHVGIQGEVLYSAIAQKYTDVDVERRIKLKYVNIPILLSLNTGKSKVVNFNIVGGPQIGISAGSTVFTKNNGNDNPSAVLAVKKGDLGFAYGAGLDFGLNSAHTSRLGIGFRGVEGLFDISDRSNTISTDSYYLLDKTKVKTYSLYVGLSIML